MRKHADLISQEYKKKSDIINAIYKYEDERLAASDLV